MATDANCNNNNGRWRALAQQMTATSERTAAWIFRGLIVVMLMVNGWLIIDKLGALDKARDSVSAAVDRVTVSEFKSATLIGRLEIQLADYIKNQDFIITELAKRETDHEDRLRHLERPAR